MVSLSSFHIPQDLEERRAAVRELRDNVAELQSNSSYNLRMREMGFQDDLKKMTGAYETA